MYAILVELLSANSSKAARKAAAMKKNMPFNTLINQSNIVDVGDEWLYNYPSFLRFEEVTPGDAKSQIQGLLKHGTKGRIVAKAAMAFNDAANERKKTAVERNRAADKLHNAVYELETTKDALENAIEILKNAGEWLETAEAPKRARSELAHVYFEANAAYKKAKDHVTELSLSRDEDSHFTLESSLITVVDTPRNMTNSREKKSGEKPNEYECGNSHELWQRLSRPRKAEEAKKRLIWLREASGDTALVCYVASPDEEKQAMLGFFDRHLNWKKWFFDDTNMALNTWTSEFHLSFYKLKTIGDQEHSIKAMPYPHELNFPGKQQKEFARASMGFRFCGDFFDEYWTCHYVESIPTGVINVPPWHNCSREGSRNQRKVLEPLFVDRILKEIVSSTRAIFEEVKTALGISGTLDPGFLFLSMLSSEEYFYSSRQWDISKQILRIIEDDVLTVLEKVSKWEMREKDRGQERPRWTHKDESEYGREISKLSMSISGNIAELKNCCTQIKSLKDNMDAGQAKKREDLSFQGSENIRIFTYVTVVFLPIGFAASIFSVDHALVVHLVTCAVVVLAITIVALFNARRFDRLFEQAANKADNYYKSHTKGSYLRKFREKEEESVDVSNTAEESSPPQGSSEKQTKLPVKAGPWHIWFWLAYMVIEVPARSVLQAYHAIRADKFTWPTFLCIGKGVLLLPIFLISWLVQLFIYNAIDSLQIIRGKFRPSFHIHLPNSRS